MKLYGVSSVMESTNLDLLQSLLARIERAWYDRGDRQVVIELSWKYPEFREQLTEFFEDLVQEFGGDKSTDPEIAKAEDRAYEWLQSRGIDEALAVASALDQQSVSLTESTPSIQQTDHHDQESSGQNPEESSPENLLMFLHRRTGQKRTAVASSLPNMSLEFLSLVSRYPGLIPGRVKLALAQSVQERFDVPVEETLRCLSVPAPLAKRAASRRLPADRAPASFEEILERAALGAAEKDFWRRCAEETV